MKNFSKHFGIIALIAVIALALAGCTPQVETVVVNSDGGANSIRKGETMNFSAAVTGKNNPSQNVKWSVSSKSDGSGAVADGTNISPSGTLIVDAKETASNIYVRATASQSADKFDYVQLKIESASSSPRTQSAGTTSATTTTTAPATQTAATTTTPAASTTTSSGGFQMSGTTLTKYTGSSASVTIPNSVTSIGDYAFFGKNNITSVTIPNSVTSIGIYAFEGCTSLKNIAIPNSVTSIGNYAFASTGLTSITIPASVTSIGEGVFITINGLTSITVDANNPNFASADGILYNKAKTEIIAVPKKLTGNVTIPNGVTLISSDFQGNTSLTGVTIPASVTSIARNAFNGSTNLNITWYYNPALSVLSVTGLQDYVKTVIIPNGVTSIKERAFYQCGKLTSVTIPNSVTSIEQNAFTSTGLTSVTIPASVTSIAGAAFDRCDSLTSVTFQGTIASDNFGTKQGGANSNRWRSPFPGNLRDIYIETGRGTYTRAIGSEEWQFVSQGA